MKRVETAKSVAAQLFKAEDAIDEAIREAARLTLAVTDARGDLRLAAVVGSDVFDRAAALQGALAASRAHAVALHGALAEVRDQLRVPAALLSPGLDKPNARVEPAALDASGVAEPPPIVRRLRSL